ncbi:MAG: hypothetical protein ACK6DF_15850, partial [Betaproteobacteria bacterium]
VQGPARFVATQVRYIVMGGIAPYVPHMLKNNTAKRNKTMFETTIKEIEINGRPEYEIRFVNSEFSDLSFKYGEVKFNEDDKQESAEKEQAPKEKKAD